MGLALPGGILLRAREISVVLLMISRRRRRRLQLRRDRGRIFPIVLLWRRFPHDGSHVLLPSFLLVVLLCPLRLLLLLLTLPAAAGNQVAVRLSSWLEWGRKDLKC